MKPSAALAAFVADSRYEALPPDLIDHARRSIVDLLMVAQAGARLPHLEPILAMLAAEGSGPARVWSDGTRLPLRSAALFNALCAAALDYDSVAGSAHGDLVVWPALLALAASRPVDGRSLIVAHAVGTEIVARLAAAAELPGPGWSPTAIYGGFGSAAASARLLGLDAAGVSRAFGIALSQAAGTQQGHVEQVLSKNGQPAFAAQAGLLAAQMAATGFTGPVEAIEGRFGLGALYQRIDQDRLLDGLGERWLILETAFKKYPVCAASHPLIESCIALAERYDLAAEDVAAIEVVVTPVIGRLVGGDFAPGDNVLVTAQFSLKYALAAAILHRALRLDHLRPEQVRDPRIAALAAKMTISVDPERTCAYGPSDLRMRLVNGRPIETRTTVFPGGPERPLTPDEWDAKYRDCAPDAGQALARIRDWAQRLPDLADVDAAWPL